MNVKLQNHFDECKKEHSTWLQDRFEIKQRKKSVTGF